MWTQSTNCLEAHGASVQIAPAPVKPALKMGRAAVCGTAALSTLADFATDLATKTELSDAIYADAADAHARQGVKAMEKLFRNAGKRQKVGVSSPQPCVSA